MSIDSIIKSWMVEKPHSPIEQKPIAEMSAEEMLKNHRFPNTPHQSQKAGYTSDRNKSALQGILWGVLAAPALAIVVFTTWPQKPIPARVVETNTISFTCLEFSSEADSQRFHRDGVIPAGSRVSSKPQGECKGVQLVTH